MNESFLHYLWSYQLIHPNLQTSSGQDLSIVRSGTQNFNSGPDFFNALIKIGGTTWAGNIEIHIHSSDWYHHNHHNDPAYDTIILHVVYKNDVAVSRQNGEEIPTLELYDRFNEKIYSAYRSFLASDKWIPCASQLASVSHFDLLSWLNHLMVERLKEKAAQIERELSLAGQDFHEIFYRKLARSFGFNTNSEAFESLASSLPFKVIARHMNDIFQVESLLFGQAGMLNRSFKDQYPNRMKEEYLHLNRKYGLRPVSMCNWRFLRMRPTNFPTVRIAQFAQLLEKSSGLLDGIFTAEKLSDVVNFFRVSASGYWDDHYIFDKAAKPSSKPLGRSSIDIILINTVVPFLFMYGIQINEPSLQSKALDWLEEMKAENNVITGKYKQLGIEAVSAVHSQALVQLKTRYCDLKQCLNCRIGQSLLR